MSKLTRRQLAAAIIAVPALAQIATPPTPRYEEDPVKATEAGNRATREQLAKFQLPMSTEPSFVFKP